MTRNDPSLPTPQVDHIIRPISAERLSVLFGPDAWAAMEPEIIAACELPGNILYLQRTDRVSVLPMDMGPVRQRLAHLLINHVREEEAQKARAAQDGAG